MQIPNIKAIIEKNLVERVLGACFKISRNATSQCDDSSSSIYSKWPNDRMVAVAGFFYTKKKRLQRKMIKTTIG